MEIQNINFAHPFYKLDRSRFSTLREPIKFQQFRVGERCSYSLQRIVQGFVSIESKEMTTLDDLSFRFLSEDMNYPGFKIHNKEHARQMMEGFYPNQFPSLTSPLIVFWCVKSRHGIEQ